MPVEQIIECKTAKEFVDTLDPSNELWTKNNSWHQLWIFRGQVDNPEWRLIPKVFRKLNENMPEDVQASIPNALKRVQDVGSWLNSLESSLLKYEYEASLAWLRQLYVEILNLSEYSGLAESTMIGNHLTREDVPVFGTNFINEYLENLDNTDFMIKTWGRPIVGIAQHHGLATRLLDWSRNALYAAFFALQNWNKTHGIAVYATHPFFLKGKNRIQLVKVAKSHSEYISAQDGLFTLDTKADKTFLETQNWPCLLDVMNVPYKITLPASEVRELARILWLRRITKAHMMPTTDNIASALMDKMRWQMVEASDSEVVMPPIIRLRNRKTRRKP